jgi:hypothetical protein
LEPGIEIFIEPALQFMLPADDAGPAAHIVYGALTAPRVDGIKEGLLFFQPIRSQFLFSDVQAGISLPFGIYFPDGPVAAVGLTVHILNFPAPFQCLIEAFIPLVPNAELPKPGQVESHIFLILLQD